MKLTDLEPRFFRYDVRVEPYQVIDGDSMTWRERGCPSKTVVGPREYHVTVATLEEAQAVAFLCPRCFPGHEVHVTFSGRGVGPEYGCHNKAGNAVRWDVSGTGLDDLSTTPSILIEDGCGWHGYITNGEVT